MNVYPKVVLPKVTLLHATPLYVAEVAGRTAYDSFDQSEHRAIREHDYDVLELIDIDSSELLDKLSWVYFHESVLEHINLTYKIERIGRGVLQELVRHRIASYTVKSTRYTMYDVLYAYIAANGDFDSFVEALKKNNVFIIEDESGIMTEAEYIMEHLDLYAVKNGDYAFIRDVLPESSIDAFYKLVEDTPDISFDEIYNFLLSIKKKRNVGDKFKFIVTDNWSTDVVMTMNLRSLKNFFKLRNSGAAWYQIRNLAKEMLDITPDKYRKLVWKES